MKEISIELEIKCPEIVNEAGFIVVDFESTEFITEEYPEGKKTRFKKFTYSDKDYKHSENVFIKHYIENNYEYICERLTSEYYNQYSPLLTKLS
jgi:hypothetical protein